MTESRGAGRPRDPEVEAGILRATQDLLVEDGYDRVTMDAVARAARTSKAAIYRRWTTKVELVIAAVRALYDPPPIPDTGSLRRDLLLCCDNYLTGGRNQRVLASLLTELARNPELGTAAFEAIGEPYAAPFGAVMRRAAERGDIPAGIDIATVATVLPALAFRNTALGGGHLDAAAMERIVDAVLLPALGAGDGAA